MNLYRVYRHLLVVFAVGIFFTSVANYTERYGVIPLAWIFVFGVLSTPLILAKMATGRATLPPIILWCALYLVVSIAAFYETPEDAFSFQAVQTRVLSVIFLALALLVLSDPEEQLLAQKWIAGAVLLAAALNVYELFNPMTFSPIPGRSQGLYPNVNQSAAALVLGLILGYRAVPDRLKMAFIGVTAIGLIPTFSRSGMIGWLVVVAYFFLRAGLVANLRRLAVLSVLVIGLISSPVWSDLQQSLQERGALNLNVLQRIAFFTGGRSTDASSSERQAVAKAAWDMFAERPITGWGTGASNRIEGFDVGAHNIYLAMMSEHGMIGVFIVPVLLLCVLWGMNRRSFDQAVPWALFMVLWGMFSHNVLEERYILLSTALMASIVFSNRTRAAPEPTPAAVPVSLSQSTLVPTP